MVRLSLSQQLRRSLLGALPQKTGAENQVFATVMLGFRMTLEDSRFERMVERLEGVDVDFRGFAYEGAGVALTVLDMLGPWKRRFPAFTRFIQDAYLIPTYIGAGLALGRMRSRAVEPFLLRQEHPAFRWMVMDGYGFYQGFYAPRPTIELQRVPGAFSAYGMRVFDQGLGRGMWFARGEDVERVASTIAGFPAARRADLWSGAGFACAYAGRATPAESLARLRELAGEHRAQLALASALAAKRRLGLGHITAHTERACLAFCGLPAQQAAGLANAALADLPPETSAPLHGVWRERIAELLAASAPQREEVLP